MNLSRVVIARPGGNDTAFVFDQVPPSKYGEINSYIQAKNRSVEQVMFVDGLSSTPAGRMAGGEFCGNAARSLGFVLREGKNGEITVNVSGSSKPLTVTVADGKSQTEMPIFNDLDCVKSCGDGITIVCLEGITHIVLESSSDLSCNIFDEQDEDQRKEIARELLRKFNLPVVPAAGVIAVTESEGTIQISPFVYVRAIDTFFAETACGSGTVAVGLVRAKAEHKSVTCLPIIQPSGQAIEVTVDFGNDSFVAASINGCVDILYDGAF